MFLSTSLFAAYLGFSLIHLGHDKAIHFCTFFILTAEYFHIWHVHRPWRITFVSMTLGASVTLEYAQNIINPARIFDYMDIAYNIAGSLLALVLCCLVQLAYSRRRRPPDLDFELRSTSPVTPITSDDDIDGFVNVHMDGEDYDRLV